MSKVATITKMKVFYPKVMFQDVIKAIVFSIAFITILLGFSLMTNAIEAGFSPPDNYMKQESLPFIKDKKEKPSNEEQKMEDLFGSEQVFPFEAGLEKSFD